MGFMSWLRRFSLLLLCCDAWAQTAHQATLAWNYTSNGNPAITFAVKRAAVSGGPYVTIGTTVCSAAGCANGAYTFTDTGQAPNALAEGTTYFYTVSANNAVGNFAGNAMEASFTVPVTPPLPAIPTNLVVTGR
jgi:hypothetical protein